MGCGSILGHYGAQNDETGEWTDSTQVTRLARDACWRIGDMRNLFEGNEVFEREMSQSMRA